MQVDAAAFLRERQSTQHVGGVTELLPYFGGEEGSQCRRNVVELMENDELIAAKRQDLLAIMKTQLYLEVVNRCSNKISLYDQASGLVCLLEKKKEAITTQHMLSSGEDRWFIRICLLRWSFRLGNHVSVRRSLIDFILFVYIILISPSLIYII